MMGFLDFLKKKPALQQPAQPGFDISKLDTGLPSIESSSLPPLDTLPALDDTLPPLDSVLQQNDDSAPMMPVPGLMPVADDAMTMQKSYSQMTVKIPPLNFSMPESDDRKNILNDVEEDLNKLFLSDEWKEPDWSSFEPYSAPDIEPPDSKDFGLETYETKQAAAEPSDLPGFDEEQPIIQVLDEKRQIPFELYVRGTHYNAVFSELTKINELLGGEDPKLEILLSYTKTEDEALGKLKDNMEYLYRKMMYIDKRIFA